MNNNSPDIGIQQSVESPKALKAKPIKILPTDRLAFEKQLGVLRAYAAASGAERKAVSNKEVGVIIPIHENTVSICNPFFQDIGLLFKEGMKNRPSDEVADYAQAYEWDTEKATGKLACVFRKSWFGTALIPKLTFRALTKDEATTFLANEAKAPKEYKPNLEVILEYLRAAGVIQSDGATITLGPNAKDSSESGNEGGQINKQGAGAVVPNEISVPPPTPDLGMKRFAVHVPDKNDAVILLPENIDQEDWEMVLEVIQMYVSRWKKFPAQKGSA